LDDLAAGLRAAMRGRPRDGRPVPRAGVMAVVVAGGDVRPGDAIVVEEPDHRPHQPLLPI
ncbi:MAG: MOSC domain-containing protein, partial [Acidimicrobiales bacterium]